MKPDRDKNPLPEELRSILAEHHREAVGTADCLACASVCCIQGGFAVLENVLLIHEKYLRGELVREDYDFPPDLSLRDFVSMYFDFHFIPTKESGKLVLYRTKHLTQNSKLLSSRPHGIAPNENVMNEAYHCHSQGCVFLNTSMLDWPLDDGLSSRGCIIHDMKCTTHLTAKPLHCIFYTCAVPLEQKIADARTSHAWIETIARYYPDSEDRFHRMMEDAPADTLWA